MHERASLIGDHLRQVPLDPLCAPDLSELLCRPGGEEDGAAGPGQRETATQYQTARVPKSSTSNIINIEKRMLLLNRNIVQCSCSTLMFDSHFLKCFFWKLDSGIIRTIKIKHNASWTQGV